MANKEIANIPLIWHISCVGDIADGSDRFVVAGPWQPTEELKPIRVIEYSAFKSLQQENQRLKERLEDAVETIIKMQNKVKPWMSPHSLMGQEITESYNLGASFLSKNPNEFNAYLEKYGVTK